VLGDELWWEIEREVSKPQSQEVYEKMARTPWGAPDRH
jgi:hypothetical protein